MSGRGADDDDDGRAFEAAVEVIAFADTFGINVEGFVADLRRAEPKPPELIPPHEAKARGRG